MTITQRQEKLRIKQEAKEEVLNGLIGLLMEAAPDEDHRNQLRLITAHQNLVKASERIIDDYGPSANVAPEERFKALQILLSVSNTLKKFSERK